MLLIGMFDSPFVRRVAVSMKLLDITFDHANWSVGRDFERIREYNPLGRVPTLVLDDGEALMESSAILDYLDESVGPERALLPRDGKDRRTALRLMAIATGTADKTVTQIYENAFRPPEKHHEPWLERCRKQVQSALVELDTQCAERMSSPWLLGERISQVDVTLACVFTFITDALTPTVKAADYPALGAATERCEKLSEFRSTRAD